MIRQDSPEWATARLGKVTASRISDVVAKTRSGWGASRGNYLAQLLCERLTGKQAETFTNAAMQWGVENEPQARRVYEFEEDVAVQPAAFVQHPRIEAAGATPDGFVGDDGLIEIKCPLTKEHIETLLDKRPSSKYVYQVQWQLACTGRRWDDFVSFDPRMPGEMQMFKLRIQRDDALIEELEAEVQTFLGELDAKLEQLRARHG